MLGASIDVLTALGAHPREENLRGLAGKRERFFHERSQRLAARACHLHADLESID